MPAYAVAVSEQETAHSLKDNRPQMPMVRTQERRKARRFALEIPAVFRWGGDDGQSRCEGAGFCRDISTSGVFVIAFTVAPPVAGKLDLMVLLPPLNPSAAALRLCANGTVVRVERMEDRIGLGIASTFCDLDTSERPASSPLEEKPSVPCA
jgi:hypothetical protein